MSDLQRRLDGQQPPQYDREALWDKIERPTPKRRRWFWFFMLGILLLASLTGVYYFEVLGVNTTSESRVDVTNEISATAIVPQSDNTIQGVEGKPQHIQSKTNETDTEVDLSATSTLTTQSSSVLAEENPVSNDQHTSKTRQINTSSPRSPEASSSKSGPLFGAESSRHFEPDISNPISDTLRLAQDRPVWKHRVLPITSPPKDLEPNPSNRSNETFAGDRSLTLAPKLQRRGMIRDTTKEVHTVLPLAILPSTYPTKDLESLTLNSAQQGAVWEPSPSNQMTRILSLVNIRPSNNEIVLSGGLAYQWHTFDGDNCEAREQESADPGYYANLTYKRILQRQFYLLSAIQYTVHYSSIEASSILAEQFIDGQSNVSIFETTTFYQLYNEYHRLDVGVGAGYTWQKESFDYGVEAQLGAAKWMKIDGNYLDENTDLQEMAGADALNPAFYGRVNASMGKIFSNGLRVGVNLGLQSPLSVNTEIEDCKHWVWPAYLGVSLGRKF